MPGGGDCEGITGAIATSRDMEPLFAWRKACPTGMDAKPRKTGVAAAGALWGLTMQQFAWTDSHGILI